ncbi:MAG: pyrroline-5-carboxylate reductase [Lachnospiraceae bacterium]|nr:pyrroline-5-carboxylate reductase [Lachnospiraceae bacterium]
MKKKIGFIGLGNMASAIIGGLLAKKMVKPEDVFGYDKSPAACEKAKTGFNITIVTDEKEAAQKADILFLAVKPNVLSEVLPLVGSVIKKTTLIISIAAGKSLAYLEENLGRSDCKIVRCMPNTPALVLEGCTGACSNKNVTNKEMDLAMEVLGAFGRASVVPEKLMDAVVGISGSSPAYVFMFIEAMADAAVVAGMPRAQAYEFCAQAVLGSAKLLLETGKHPGELKDMVCSPAGTTIEAVKVLEEKGFRAAVMDATLACIEKSKNI